MKAFLMCAPTETKELDMHGRIVDDAVCSSHAECDVASQHLHHQNLLIRCGENEVAAIGNEVITRPRMTIWPTFVCTDHRSRS